MHLSDISEHRDISVLGSLEKICQDIHNHKSKEYADNYLELYKDKNNNVLNSII